MGVRDSFRRFTRRVADTVDRLADIYGLNRDDVGYDAIFLDPNLTGTGVLGYNGVTNDGRTVLGVSPEINSETKREVADHEASHCLLPPNLIGGIYGRVKDWVIDISRVLAEADVIRNMVDVLGYNLNEIKGYHEIKEGLLKIGRKFSEAAGGAGRLYNLVRERAQYGILDIINNSDLKSYLTDFVRFNGQKLGRYGMGQQSYLQLYNRS